MDEDFRRDLETICEKALDIADDTWKNVGPLLEKRSVTAGAMVPSSIPGHPFVGEPEVDEFIAMVVDLRNSSEHLLQCRPGGTVELLQRVFLETSALIPVCARVARKHHGRATEYLGDGVLALFRISGGSPQRDETIKQCWRAARDCLDATRDIINPILHRRYDLPAIDVGIGLGISRAIVTLVGAPEAPLPKAFGECVWRATKLSDGQNEICVDRALREQWPEEKGGRVKFRPKHSRRGYDGFVAYVADG